MLMDMLDLDTFTLRAKDIFPEEGLKRKECVLKLYDRFLERKGLQHGLESLNLWLDDTINWEAFRRKPWTTMLPFGQ